MRIANVGCSDPQFERKRENNNYHPSNKKLVTTRKSSYPELGWTTAGGGGRVFFQRNQKSDKKVMRAETWKEALVQLNQWGLKEDSRICTGTTGPPSNKRQPDSSA